MFKNKSIPSGIIIIQLLCGFAITGSNSFADTSSINTPEGQLLRSAISLQGRHLNDNAEKSALQKLFTDYQTQSASESSDLRSENFKGALISLGIKNQSQADALFGQSAKLNEAASVDGALTPDALSSRIASIVKAQPQGEQFSACTSRTFETNEMIAGIAGVVIGTVGAVANWGYTCPAGSHMENTINNSDNPVGQSCFRNGTSNNGGTAGYGNVGKIRSTAGLAAMYGGFGLTAAVIITAVVVGETCH
jgi:hypothetical protein